MRPGQCVGAGQRLLAFYWRDKRVDTVRYAPETDSIPAPVARAIRACATRFSEATTAPRELIDLFNLQLWLGDIATARALEAKVMAAQRARSPVEQGWMLYRIFRMYLRAKPARVADATRVLAQLEAMNLPVAPWRVLAHGDMIDYDLGVNKVAEAVGHGRAAVVANRAMPRNDRADRVLEMWETWKSYAEATSVQSGGPAAVRLLDTASADLVPLLGPPSIGATLDGGASQAAFPRNVTEAKYPQLRQRIGSMRTTIPRSVQNQKP
jgi:hypothetical protein